MGTGYHNMSEGSMRSLLRTSLELNLPYTGLPDLVNTAVAAWTLFSDALSQRKAT